MTELISIIYIKFVNFEVLLKSELDFKRQASEAFLREQKLTLASTLSLTKFITFLDMIFVTLYCTT